MTDPMIEKLARVIWDHQLRLKASTSAEKPECVRDMVSAFLTALLEPDDEMKSIEDVHWGYRCHVCGGLTEGWQAMLQNLIDRAKT